MSNEDRQRLLNQLGTCQSLIQQLQRKEARYLMRDRLCCVFCWTVLLAIFLTSV